MGKMVAGKRVCQPADKPRPGSAPRINGDAPRHIAVDTIVFDRARQRASRYRFKVASRLPVLLHYLVDSADHEAAGAEASSSRTASGALLRQLNIVICEDCGLRDGSADDACPIRRLIPRNTRRGFSGTYLSSARALLSSKRRRCFADSEQEARLVYDLAALLHTATGEMKKMSRALWVARRGAGRHYPTAPRCATHPDLPAALLDSVHPAEELVRSVAAVARLHSSSWVEYSADPVRMHQHLQNILHQGAAVCQVVQSRLAGRSGLHVFAEGERLAGGRHCIHK